MTQENRYIQNVGHSAGQLTQFLQQVNGMEKGGGGCMAGKCSGLKEREHLHAKYGPCLILI